MSAVTVTLTDHCGNHGGGGNHLTFSVTGDATLTRMLNLSDLSDPISEQDVQAFLHVIAKLAKKGRTVAQARTLLQAGVTVTV